MWIELLSYAYLGKQLQSVTGEMLPVWTGGQFQCSMLPISLRNHVDVELLQCVRVRRCVVVDHQDVRARTSHRQAQSQRRLTHHVQSTSQTTSHSNVSIHIALYAETMSRNVHQISLCNNCCIFPSVC